MKKLIMTIAIVLGMGAMTFAQDVEVYEEAGLFGKGAKMFQNRSTESLIDLPSEHGSEDDADAPLGSGIAVLMGLGAAYMVAKKRKED